MPNSRKILIVDDDAELRTALVEQLALHDEFEAEAVDSGTKGVQAAKAGQVDLVIMDVGLPDVDGREAVRILRKSGFKAPIIMLTGHDTDSDTILGLESGANDYITKPFGTDELLARVRANLRRAGGDSDVASFDVGDFRVDIDARRVHVRGNEVRLTPKEFELFVYMARHPNRVLGHRTLLEAVWGEASQEQPEYLRVFMGQLRKKLEPDPSNPKYLVTEPWVGYRFNPNG